VATVDEGNNWVNMRWGPLSLTNPSVRGGTNNNFGGGALLSNYALAAGSPGIDYVPVGQSHPSADFFGNMRPDPASPGRFDVGAVEFGSSGPPPAGPTLTSISPASGARGNAVGVTLTGTGLTGTQNITVSGSGVTASAITVVNDTTVTATFTITGTAALTARNVVLGTAGGTSNTVTFTVTGPTVASVSPSSGTRSTAVAVTITGADLQGATAVTVSGAGVTVSNFAAVNATTVTATFTIASTAGLGTRNVTVATPNGNAVGAGAFTVTGATVTFTNPGLTTTPANTATKTGTITVSNTATGANAGPLTLTAAPAVVQTVPTPPPTKFSITGGTCAAGSVVNPGSSCTITVQYAPGGVTTTATAHVSLANTGAATSPLNGPNFNGN
jgi:hypothetical protein